MGHSYYVCNTKDRTCFDLSDNIMTEDFEELCRLTCLYNVPFDDFLDLSDDRMKVFDTEKIRQLYEYIRTIPPAYFEWAPHEDVLCEVVFDTLNDSRPIEQVGSLYSNCDKHTFNKCSRPIE